MDGKFPHHLHTLSFHRNFHPSHYIANSIHYWIAHQVKFLKWLTDKDQQAFLAETTNNIPANRNSLNKVSDNLAEFARSMDNSTHPNIWGVSEFSLVIEAFDKGIFATLTYLYHHLHGENLSEIRAYIKEKCLNLVELNDLFYHATVIE
jgi:hypothetical protein